jgi:excinuclease ABC subunit C
MLRKDLKRIKLPDAPGVYFFIGTRKEILYIGKATSLRDRVKSYFARDIVDSRGPAIAKMLSEAKLVDFQKTDSVLEALILEANLIKKHQPQYNVRDKDDKSFNYIVITNEAYPRVMRVRGKDLSKHYPPKMRKYLFGPFPHGLMFKEAMKVIRKLFPYYDTKTPIDEMTSNAGRAKLRFNRSLGLYPDESVSKEEYARTIKHIKLFLSGKKSALITELEKEMKRYAREEQFEKAGRIKKVLFGVRHIQDISLLKREMRDLGMQHMFRIEAYDVAHIQGTNSVGAMVVLQNGEAQKSEYRKFRVRNAVSGSDTGALEEVLVRRFAHDEWILPQLIVVDGGKAQLNVATRVLKEHGYRIPVVSVVKDERHKARALMGDSTMRGEHAEPILLANAEAHRFALSYHRKRRRVL